MGECNPACQKIILNGGFMAALAKLLIPAIGGAARSAAERLADTGTALVAVYDHALDHGVVTAVENVQFAGCEQATTMLEWLRTDVLPESAAKRMNTWSDEMLAQIADLVAATDPHQGEGG